MRAAAGSTHRRPRRRPTRLVAGVVASTALAVGLVATSVAAVQAVPPTTDPVTAAEYGARWIAAQYDPAGFVPGPTDAPNIGQTLQSTLALAAAGVEEPTFDQAMTWLQANAATVITGDDPARIGYLLLLADAAGIAPTTFGGLDLPALLLATEGDFAPGLFGAADPTYDGAFRQSIAIMGLVASGTAVPGSASTWLADQQCDSATPAAEGGWQAYRADLAQPCDAPDPINYTGPDTNATAVALQALLAVGSFPGSDDALDFLEASQSSDGGFAYVAGGDTDPNSTALVVQAIVAGGEDPAGGRWLVGTSSPITSLLSWQVGCDAPVADQGAFASPFSDGFPDEVATGQAVWGAAGLSFPLDGPVAFTAAAVPCLPPSSTTTTTTASTSTTTSGGATTTSTAPGTSVAAQPIVIEPRFAG